MSVTNKTCSKGSENGARIKICESENKTRITESRSNNTEGKVENTSGRGKVKVFLGKLGKDNVRSKHFTIKKRVEHKLDSETVSSQTKIQFKIQ